MYQEIDGSYVMEHAYSKLDGLVPLNTQDRIEKVQAMFRTVVMYPCKEEGPFIIQCFHEGNSIDWLEIKRGGVDPEGYGVFALQDIEKDDYYAVFR